MEGAATASYWTTGCTCASVGGVGGEEGTGEFGVAGLPAHSPWGIRCDGLRSARRIGSDDRMAGDRVRKVSDNALTDAMTAAAPSITSVANASKSGVGEVNNCALAVRKLHAKPKSEQQ